MKAKATNFTMAQNCKMKVIGMWRPDSKIISKTNERGTVNCKNAACQATSDSLPSEIIMPIMFCTMFSPMCEASVQVNLPITSSIGRSSRLPTVGLEDKESTHQPLEPVESDEKKEKQTHRKICDVDFEHAYSLDPYDDDTLSLSSLEEDYVEKEPEDSEYSSDNDLEFWRKMEMHTKPKRKKSCSNKVYSEYPSEGDIIVSKRGQYSYISKKCKKTRINDEEQSMQAKESSKRPDNGSSLVMEARIEGDDWITDDEVDDDEEDLNFELAFQREWKAKRLPINTKEKNFVCDVCGKRFSKHFFLRNHIVRDHKDHSEAKRYPHSCPHCKKVYMGKTWLLHHQQQFSGPCEVCGEVLKCSNLFWLHRRNHDIKCDVCKRTFKTKYTLDQHTKNKHGDRPFSCPNCPKKFVYKSLCNAHIARSSCIPTGDNPQESEVKCEYCGFLAKTYRGLRVHHGYAHKHEHDEHEKHNCDQCDFSCKTKRALKIHQRMIHSSEPIIYTCKKCNSTFTSRKSYKRHVVLHVSEGTSIVCQVCSENFASEGELQAHTVSIHAVSDEADSSVKEIRSTHFDNNHSVNESQSSHFNNSYNISHLCALCDTAVGDSEALALHMHKYHGMDEDPANDIRPNITSVPLLETNESTAGMAQVVVTKQANPQQLDTRTQNLPATVSFPTTDLACSDDRPALLTPASAMSSSVKVIEMNGVRYHVI